jgi:hypothetical protein
MQEEKFYIIAAGGYLPRPVVEEIVIKESEMVESEDDFADFEDYKTYILEEAAAEFEQRFAKAIILTEAQAKRVNVYLPK